MTTPKRGFAAMDRAKLAAISSRGGKSTSPENRTWAKRPELAAQAGAKGGKVSRKKAVD